MRPCGLDQLAAEDYRTCYDPVEAVRVRAPFRSDPAIPRPLRGTYLRRVADLLRDRDLGDGDVHRAAIAAGRETMQPAASRGATPRIERPGAAVGRDGENLQNSLC